MMPSWFRMRNMFAETYTLDGGNVTYLDAKFIDVGPVKIMIRYRWTGGLWFWTFRAGKLELSWGSEF